MTTGTRASCTVPLGYGPNSAEGTRAPSAIPLSRGINSVTVVRASSVAPLNHGKGACPSRAASLSHASRSNEAAATALRSPKRTCSPPLLPDHVVAVGLRCGKTNTTAPRYFQGSIQCFLATAVGALFSFPSKRQDGLPRPPFPRGLTEKCFSGGTFVATHSSPAPEDAYRVCRPSLVFMHANPRASGFVVTIGTGRITDTARRATGDAKASSQISRTLFP